MLKVLRTNGKKITKLRFIDSYKFLTSSLDKLASVKFLSKDKLWIMQREFSKLLAENFDLFTRKGIFSYKYIDCVEKLEDTCLPPRESFYRQAISYPRIITRTPSTCGSGFLFEPSANIAIYI